MEKQLFKNLKILSSFALFISNTKNAHILNFFIRKIFRQTFIISESLTYMDQLLLKLRAVKVAILFHLPQLIRT